MLRPAVAARDHVRPREAEHEDGRCERVDEVLEQIERLVVREVEIVEDEDDRAAASRRLRRADHHRVLGAMRGLAPLRCPARCRARDRDVSASASRKRLITARRSGRICCESPRPPG